MRSDVEETARVVVGCGYHLHQNPGPGLLDLPPGLLINFGGSTFKEGIPRIANGDLAR